MFTYELIRSRVHFWHHAKSFIFGARKLKFGIWAYVDKINCCSKFEVNGVKLGSSSAFFKTCVFYMILTGNIMGSHFYLVLKSKFSHKEAKLVISAEFAVAAGNRLVLFFILYYSLFFIPPIFKYLYL